MNPQPGHWRWVALAGALLGFTAVLLGAIGSHAIDLSGDAALRRWNVALQIHFFQAAALLALAGLQAAVQGGNSRFDTAGSSAASFKAHGPARWLNWIGGLQFTGTLLFCGSLYLRSAQPPGLPGWITPAGGLVLLAGWLLLLVMLVAVRVAKQP